MTSTDYGKGLLLAALGGLLLTVDIPLIRLSEGEPWSVMLLRSSFVLVFALAYIGIRSLISGRAILPVPGRAGWVVTLFYSISAVFFLMAVYNTATANLVFILAFNPTFAALLGWIFLKERPRGATLLTMAAMTGGILIIVQEGLTEGNLAGDAMALASGFFMAAAITVSRHSRKDMSLTPLIGMLGPCLIAAAMVIQNGYRVDMPVWIVLDGLIALPLSFFCLALAPKYLSGPEVAMFYLLETVITPFWIWLIFAEAPTTQAAIGGTILIAALLMHSVWQLRGRA